VTVECPRGVDDSGIRAALAEAMRKLGPAAADADAA
jgi:hypothetical protein